MSGLGNTEEQCSGVSTEDLAIVLQAARLKLETVEFVPVYEDIPELSHMRHVKEVLAHDYAGLDDKERQYRGSWKSRGGVGAFMMLARKWDRLEPFVGRYGYDIFEAVHKDRRPEGVIDDIRDLRRYLALVESHCIDINLITQATP